MMTVSEASKPGVCNFLWKGRVEFSQPHIFRFLPSDSPSEPLLLQRAGLEPQAGPSAFKTLLLFPSKFPLIPAPNSIYITVPQSNLTQRGWGEKGTKSQGLTWEATLSVDSPPSGKGRMRSASGKAPNHDFTFTSCLGIPKQTDCSAP